MNLKLIGASVLLILLAACGGAPPAAPISSTTFAPTAGSASTQPIPVFPPTAALTPLVEPTAPPTPQYATPAETPTALPAGIAAEVPVLIALSVAGLQSIDIDGKHLQTFDQAQLSLGRNLSDGIAPSGGHVAFVGGDNPMTSDREGSGPLMLNLLDTRTGIRKPIAPLFSPAIDHAIRAAQGERTETVEAGIAIAENSGTLQWSPDGRYLAFIAAIDGLSSDVYSYDRESETISRLTDGPNQAARLFWSPDSRWIVHEEVESFGTGAGWNVKAVWAAAPDGSGNRKLYDAASSGDEVFVDWVSPDTFLVYSWTAIGLQNIRLVNLATGEAQRIGPEFPVQAYAVEPQSQTQLYVIGDYTARQNGLTGGLYLDTPGAPPQQIAPGNWYDARWLPHAQLFFAKGESGVISVALDGTLTNYFGEGALPIDSPDGAWLLARGDGNFTSPIGLRLYTPDGELKRGITQDAVTLATWSPDSTGAFYVSDGKLYHVAIPNGDPELIDENTTATETGSLGWVMP